MAGDNRGSELATVVIILLIFCLLTVSMRCYTVLCILKKRFYSEDWLAVVTLLLYLAYSVFALISIRYGLGGHVEDIPPAYHQRALMFKWLGQVFYVIIAVLVKFVAGVLLLRLCLHQRWQRITIWTMLGIMAVFNAVYIFVVIFQCRPIQFYWFRYASLLPPELAGGECHKSALATIPTYISFSMNVATDWMLALLPVSFVWNAKMDRKTKFSVVGLLAIGSIASMATCARIPYAKQLLSNPDYLYNFTDLAIWSTVEIGLALIASSCATLRPLFRKIKLLPSKIHSRAQGSIATSHNSRANGTAHSRVAALVPQPSSFEVIKDDAWNQFDFGIAMEAMDHRVPIPSKTMGKEIEDEIHVMGEGRDDVGRSGDFPSGRKGGYGVDNDLRC